MQTPGLIMLMTSGMDSILKCMWAIRRFNRLRFRMRREVPSLLMVVNMGETHKQLAWVEGAITLRWRRDSTSVVRAAVWAVDRQGWKTDVLCIGRETKSNRTPSEIMLSINGSWVRKVHMRKQAAIVPGLNVMVKGGIHTFWGPLGGGLVSSVFLRFDQVVEQLWIVVGGREYGGR